ncbi:MAG: hypothetical protein WC997_04460 [Porticoccaceae bacterium]
MAEQLVEQMTTAWEVDDGAAEKAGADIIDLTEMLKRSLGDRGA